MNIDILAVHEVLTVSDDRKRDYQAQIANLARVYPDIEPARHQRSAALRCRTALQHGYQSLKQRPVCTSTAVEVCRTLKGVDVDIRRTLHTQLINDRSGAFIDTAPEGEARLRDMLANWERFLQKNQTEIDPLLRKAVGHYQFEAIHPFTDGNWRTGRVINILYLIQQELLTLPVLYLGCDLPTALMESVFHKHLWLADSKRSIMRKDL